MLHIIMSNPLYLECVCVKSSETIKCGKVQHAFIRTCRVYPGMSSFLMLWPLNLLDQCVEDWD